MQTIAHSTGSIIWWGITFGAVHAGARIKILECALLETNSSIPNIHFISSVLVAILVVEDTHFDGSLVAIASRFHKICIVVDFNLRTIEIIFIVFVAHVSSSVVSIFVVAIVLSILNAQSGVVTTVSVPTTASVLGVRVAVVSSIAVVIVISLIILLFFFLCLIFFILICVLVGVFVLRIIQLSTLSISIVVAATPIGKTVVAVVTHVVSLCCGKFEHDFDVIGKLNSVLGIIVMASVFCTAGTRACRTETQNNNVICDHRRMLPHLKCSLRKILNRLAFCKF
mmetsp:Transcript_14544/g.18988  ORF Transcript_14544/g.18988 Transcript_14544/m.18988 type:complete len:283 (-) Transcript_14544:421-1269(-)